MADLPLYVTEQDDRSIHQRMLQNLPPRYDKSEGSFAWDLTAPAAVELAQANVQAQRIVELIFRPRGAWLDAKVAEAGLTRRPPSRAKGQVTFEGTPGTLIPAGFQVSTASVAGRPAAIFETDWAATIGGTGRVTVAVTAVTLGAAGNVAAGTITFMAQPLPGITALWNDEPTSGGVDEEDDDALWARFLERRQNPPAGGNLADYKAWAMEVPGVGGAQPVAVAYGPGTVSVAIIGVDKKPASADLVEQVQEYIAPRWGLRYEAETLTPGSGATVEADPLAENGQAMKLTGNGTIYHNTLHSDLPRPGVWELRVWLRATDTSGGGAALLQVYNQTAGDLAQATPGGPYGQATKTVQDADLHTDRYEVYSVRFYWNGTDELQGIVSRQSANGELYVDRIEARSTFSRDDGSGRAPVGAAVTVEAAEPVTIDIRATLVLKPGYEPAAVHPLVEQALARYIESLAFAPDNDVRYGRVGQAILDVEGVQDYSDLLVNEASTNVVIGPTQVAVLGTVTLL